MATVTTSQLLSGIESAAVKIADTDQTSHLRNSCKPWWRQCAAESAMPVCNIDFSMLNEYSIQDLQAFTESFDKENLIGITQFGKLYRGKIRETAKETRTVTVKILKESESYYLYHDEIDVLFLEELKVLTHQNVGTHPNMVKLIGYCREEQIRAVVYDLNPLDTLHNVMTKDNFGWSQRVKVVLELARVLKFLHSEENSYLVENIDTAHILLDQDYKPFIIDFGLMSGGVIGKQSEAKYRTPMTPCYADVYGASSGRWDKYCDVYSFGVILIELVTKRITEVDDVCNERIDSTGEWALKTIESGKSVDVHQSLKEDPLYNDQDGRLLVTLGLRCVEYYPSRRPSSSRTVRCLDLLRIVRNGRI